MRSEQEFAETVSPWALNASQLDRLRQHLADAESEGDEQDAKALRRELARAENERLLDHQRAEMAAQRALPRPVAAQAQGAEEFFADPVPYWLAGNADEAPALRPGDSADVTIARFGYGRAMMAICEGIQRGTLVPGRD